MGSDDEKEFIQNMIDLKVPELIPVEFRAKNSTSIDEENYYPTEVVVDITYYQLEDLIRKQLVSVSVTLDKYSNEHLFNY